MSTPKAIILSCLIYTAINAAAIAYCVSIGGQQAPWRSLVWFVFPLPAAAYLGILVLFYYFKPETRVWLIIPIVIVTIMAAITAMLLHSVAMVA